MPSSDDIPSSPPGPGSSLEESLKFYKAHYELLESELADFQSSSKDLEAELEKEIDAADKRERQLKDRVSNLQYEVNEWKEKYRQAKTEGSAAQNRLQKEVTSLRDENRNLNLKLRDIEVANDDFERQQRNNESSLEDMQQQYNQAFEKSVLFEQEVQKVEQEREDLRINVQRLRDELQDLKIEADITKEKLKQAEESLGRRPSHLSLEQVQTSLSPRSELSPTTTNTSSPSFDTPPAKTASLSEVSDTRTPPSPPISEKSNHSTKPFTTPHIPKTRISLTTTPRLPNFAARPTAHGRGGSSTVAPRSSTFRQSLSKAHGIPQPSGLPQSSSIMQLRNLRGKMQNLEQRVQKARSKLPAPVNTPPRASPRPGSALGHQIPSSVTVRSRKRTVGSAANGSAPDSDAQSTPSISRTKSSRQSLSQQYQNHLSHPATSPSRLTMGPPRPSSRASGVSSRASGFIPGHSRPGSRASISNLRAPLGSGAGSKFTPNASTDRVIHRPQSSLSDYHRSTGYDGHFDEDDESILEESATAAATPTPRRTTLTRPRTSDVGLASAIPSPTKRISLSGSGLTRLPGPSRRQSQSNINGLARPESRTGVGIASNVDLRPSSRALGGVQEGQATPYDINETF